MEYRERERIKYDNARGKKCVMYVKHGMNLLNEALQYYFTPDPYFQFAHPSIHFNSIIFSYFVMLCVRVFEFALCFYVRDNFFLSLHSHSFHLYTILLVEFFASFLSHFDFTLCHLLCVCVFLYHQCIEQGQELKLYAKEGKLPSLQCVHTIYLKTHTHSLCGSIEKGIRIIQSLLKSQFIFKLLLAISVRNELNKIETE